jgi:hypothetical protein
MEKREQAKQLIKAALKVVTSSFGYGRFFDKTELSEAKKFVAKSLQRGRRVFQGFASPDGFFLVLEKDQKLAEEWYGHKVKELTSPQDLVLLGT